MENELYIYKMYQEFQKANGLDLTIQDFPKYQTELVDWLETKAAAANSYAGLVCDMGLDKGRDQRIVEFDKGIFDTSMISLAEETDTVPVVVSPYADTLEKVSGVETANGRLVCFKNNVFVSYATEDAYYTMPNCHPRFGDDISTLLTQTPFTMEQVLPFLLLSDDDRTVFIGTNGNMDDADRDDNLNKIRNLYAQIYDVDGIHTDYRIEADNGSYVSALKIGPKQKIKKLVKTL